MQKNIVAAFMLFFGMVGLCWAGVTVDSLSCEYLKTPLGVDSAKPRLGWTLQSNERGQSQTAYQILVASTSESLAKDQGDLWDSGKVGSDETIHIEYAGKPLESQSQYYWKVRAWDQAGKVSPWSKPASWTTGLLKPEDWQAEWIGAGENLPEGAAAVLLRKKWDVEQSIRRATVSICGLGYYELFLNGEKVGDHKLDPGFTDYARRALYVTYDVTNAVKQGNNAVGVILGNGWYKLPEPDLFGFQAAPWVATPRLLFRLRLDLADGTTQTIISDGSWKWSTGEIVFQSIRGGETHDMRLAKPGWQNMDHDDSQWDSVAIVSAPKGKLVAQLSPAIKTDGDIQAIELTQPKPGVYVYKLAENTAGWIRFATSGEPGQKITFRCNESLNPGGTISDDLRSHTHGRYQTGELILSGKGREVFESRFCYHGFQYVQVEGLVKEPKIDDLVGVRVHTLPEKAGEFSCSNDRINLLQTLFLRTYLNNLHSIPTDCPQREKMGWMDDGCVCEELGIYNYHAAQFYTKWFHDMVDAQDANGHSPDIVPTCGWGKSRPDGSIGDMADPWWGGAIVITPWRLYEYYGDKRVLSEGYDAMKAYVDYLTAQSKENVVEWGLGDWLDESAGGGGRRVPVAQTSTACYFYLARIVSQTASILGKTADAEEYASLAEGICRTFDEKFLDKTTGLYAQDSQTAQAIPLCVEIVPEEKRPLVLEGLVESIVGPRQGHISAGIVGVPYLFHALMKYDRNDLAYTMLTQETYPGWLHMVNQGGTTVWEAWNGAASRNHPTFGCVGFWLYRGLAGIGPDVTSPGFKHITIKPAVVGDLQWVKAKYDSVRGPISSKWSVTEGRLQLDFEIPANTTATVYVPTNRVESVTESGKCIENAPGVKFLRTENGAAVFDVVSGKYSFQAELQKR